MAAALAVSVVAGGAHAVTVAVSADRLLDVATGKYVEKPLVTITDGRIASVGHQGDKVPAGAARVDLPGVTLLPGLIDMHVHLTSSPLFGGYNRLEFTDSFWPIIGTTHAKATLEAGFTTVRNVGSRRTTTTSACARRSRTASSPARGSSRRPTPSARPAGTATRPSSRRR